MKTNLQKFANVLKQYFERKKKENKNRNIIIIYRKYKKGKFCKTNTICICVKIINKIILF